jgi:uncharacterized membrane protein YkvA (DUF1232 family)
MPSRFSEFEFWEKLTRYAKAVGRTMVEHALLLYHVFKDPDTPGWAKAAIISALAYFISPVDLIPDFVPVVGFTDDFAALVTALSAVTMHVKPEHRELARQTTEKFFGPSEPDPES